MSSVLAERTGDERLDLIRALRVVEEVRLSTGERGGTLVRALRTGGEGWEPLSWRQIEQETGVDPRTAGRWADET